MKKYNFGAGPSILPAEVMQATADACVNFNGLGLSLMEISHRTKDFQAVMDEAQALFKELLSIPEGYSVLFGGGGASLQFAMVPMNMLQTKAAYLNTGVWAKKAIKEAKGVGEVVEVEITTSDALRRAIGSVIINGTTVFNKNEYTQRVTASGKMSENGLQIVVRLLIQASNT